MRSLEEINFQKIGNSSIIPFVYPLYICRLSADMSHLVRCQYAAGDSGIPLLESKTRGGFSGGLLRIN